MVEKRRQQTRVRRRNGFVICCGVLLCVFAAFFGAGMAMLPPEGLIASGVQVDGIALGGKTEAQATAALANALEPLLDKQVTLSAGNAQQSVTLRELGLQCNTAATVRSALAIGHNGSLPQRIFLVVQARWNGKSLMRPAFTLDTSQTDAVMQELASNVQRPPVNASAVWRDGRVEVTPGHSGEQLDTVAAAAQISDSLLGSLNDRQEPATNIALPCGEKPPRVPTEALQQVDTILGAYSTSYASSSGNRVNNVVEAAKAINHVIVMPGETFSFNRTVGPRSEDTGFKEAPVIIRGKLEEGIGGGICQVSTTLYNAVLLANLKIVTRNHHSLPSHYVPTGLDATVSYGTLDFCFCNSSPAPVVIESLPGGGRLLVRILGKGPAPQVHIERSGLNALPPHTETRPDASLPLGKRVVTPGRPTKEVTVYRVVDGHRELLSHDRYVGEPTLVRVGSGPAEGVVKPGLAPAPATAPPVSTPPDARNSPRPKGKPHAKVKPKAKPKPHQPAALTPAAENMDE